MLPSFLATEEELPIGVGAGLHIKGDTARYRAVCVIPNPTAGLPGLARR